MRLFAQQTRDVLLMRRIERSGGLLEERPRRLDRQYTGQVYALALTARQGGEPTLRPSERAGCAHGPMHRGIVLGLAMGEPTAVREATECHDFGRREIRRRGRLCQPGEVACAFAPRPRR